MSIIAEILKAKGLTFQAHPRGLVNKDGWKRYSFTIYIGDVSLDYGMGVAHEGKTPSPDDVVPCMILDAEYGKMTLKEFCDELGYELHDKDGRGYNKLSKNVWEACKAQRVKFSSLGFTKSEMEAIKTYIEEKGL